MSEYITVEEKTIEDAITEAKIILGASTDEIDYEVIEQGSKGFLGMGAKNAVIRARKKETEVTDNNNVVTAKHTTAPKDKTEMTEKSEKPIEEPVKPAADLKPLDSATTEKALNISKRFLTTIFDDLGMKVDMEQTIDSQDNSLLIELSGDEMGLLIGKRGQTLDSIQYLTSLVVNKDNDSYVHIKIDTENYRERRKATLENLAHNISAKVKRSNRPVALEPMNPYERRVIHYALQNDKGVSTHSEGTEPYRKIIVTPKRRHS